MAWTVLTPIPLICHALLDQMLTVYPDLTTKFDPTLQYVESIKGVRAMRSAFDITKEQVFPLYTFSLGVLQPFAQIRKFYPIEKDIPNLVAKQYIGRYCKFEVPFKWYYSDIVASKTFEVMYSTETSVNQIRHLQLNWGDIGTFEYQVVWPFTGLESCSYNKQDNLYMSLDGKCEITGEFVMGSDVPAKLIGEIDLKVADFVNRTKIYDSAVITPTGTVWTSGN